jgi:hypothetical protein
MVDLGKTGGKEEEMVLSSKNSPIRLESKFTLMFLNEAVSARPAHATRKASKYQ